MRVSIIVAPPSSWGAARRLMASLDRLQVPTDEFETVFLHTSEGDVPEELSALLPFRPNLRIQTVDDPDDVAAWRDQLAGEFTLGLTAAETLFPRALDELTDFAAAHQLDAVAGRVVGRWGEIPADVSDDEPDTSPRTGEGLLWLVRTHLAGRAEAGRLIPPAETRCGGTGTYPVAARHSGSSPDLATSSETVLSWVEGRLQVATTLPRSVTEARLVLQHSRTLEARLVPASAQAAEASTATSVSAEIDPCTAAGGGPLDAGSWIVRLEVADGDGVWSVLQVAPGTADPALIRSLGVVVSGGKSLSLDVGPLATPLLPAPAVSSAQIVESARGSVLSLPLPGLYCFETERLDGRLFLDKIAVPARIEVADGVAKLSAWVSGVAGDQPLAVQFGPGAVQGLGLTLRIDGLGAMTVIPTPPPKPAAQPPKPKTPAAKTPAKNTPAKKSAANKSAAKKSAAKKTSAKKKRARARQPQGPVAKLRRAVPKPVEPLVRRLSEVPALRKLYRRATRR